MNNKKKNILVWIFVWAGLLIAVLYSPIGSPDLYSTKGYFVGNQSVNFKGDAIENAPNGGKFAYEDNNNQIDVPSYSSSSEDNSPKYAVNSYSITANTSGSTTSASYNASQSSTYQNTNGNSSSGNIGGGGGTFISNNSSSRSSNDASSAVTMNNGITTLSSGLTASSPTKQAVLSHGGHGTDPGGNPNGPPIPVGDGWVFLLVLAAGYGVWRKKFRVVTKTQIEK